MVIKIAGIVIDVKNKYNYFNEFAKEFEYDGKADFTVEVSDEIMQKVISESPDFPDGYLESLEIYRIICRKILDYDAMLMHCAAVAVDGEAYLFTALSGTGKTTHIRLWSEKFGDRFVVVNGDKPILRQRGDKFFACGTPWRGKENYGHNIVAPIKAICILQRGEKNEIRKIPPHEAISTILTQTLRTDDMAEMEKMLTITDKLLSRVPFYVLSCNMEKEAADVSYNGMQN